MRKISVFWGLCRERGGWVGGWVGESHNTCRKARVSIAHLFFFFDAQQQRHKYVTQSTIVFFCIFLGGEGR